MYLYRLRIKLDYEQNYARILLVREIEILGFELHKS
jgi:hypothetical protein